jgi:hypothetical protein
MALLDHFRRRDIRDPAAAGIFIDEQAFHLAQASVHGYCRLRAQGSADALFASPSFAAALEKACWEAYPRVLAMLGATIDASLRAHARDNASAVLSGLVAMILGNFDRRPVPKAVGDVEWRAARADLERSLDEIGRRRLVSAEAVVQDHASFYLAIMPLHPGLGPDDLPALRDELKRSLLHVQDTFVQRASRRALVGELAARMPKVETSEAPSAPV